MNERIERLIDAAWLAYRQDHANEAVRLAQEAVNQAPKSGAALYALACAHERNGNLLSADKIFRRAAKAIEEPMQPPYRSSWKRFQRAVERAQERLPAAFSKHLDGVAWVLADYPKPEQVGNDDAEVLGLYEGPSLADKTHEPNDEQPFPLIHLFRRPHEHAARSAKEFDEEVERTVRHEFGHYLSLDEEDLEDAGLG